MSPILTTCVYIFVKSGISSCLLRIGKEDCGAAAYRLNCTAGNHLFLFISWAKANQVSVARIVLERDHLANFTMWSNGTEENRRENQYSGAVL